MRAVVAAALRHLEHPVLWPIDDGTMTEDELDRREDDIDDAIAALEFILSRFLPRWKLARIRAGLTRRTP